MWEEFCLNNYLDINTKHDSFKFCGGGKIGDELANLVLSGTKTATSSLKLAYDLDNEELPKVGEYSVILFDNNSPACVIKTVKVSIVPFNKVDSLHAYKEGEDDKSLEKWKQVHRSFFAQIYNEAGLDFDENGDCVLEEFKVVYK